VQADLSSFASKMMSALSYANSCQQVIGRLSASTGENAEAELSSADGDNVITVSVTSVCSDIRRLTAETDADYSVMESGQNKKNFEKLQATENGEKVRDVEVQHRTKMLKAASRTNASDAAASVFCVCLVTVAVVNSSDDDDDDDGDDDEDAVVIVSSLSAIRHSATVSECGETFVYIPVICGRQSVNPSIRTH